MGTNRLRVVASILCIVAYALVTQGFVVLGTGLNLLTNVLFAPFFIRERLWDMLLIEVVYVVINFAALLRLTPGPI